jgi:adenylate cyclase class 2
MEKEREVKVLGIDLEEFEARLLEKGAKLIRFEKQINLLFDPPVMEGTDSYLRIRTSRDLNSGEESSVLTLKVHESAEQVRTNTEFTTPVSDPETLSDILWLSGLGKPIHVEKIRKSYLLRGARIDLDRWEEAIYPEPYAEIEVDTEEKLDAILTWLSIDKAQVSTKSIRQLMAEMKEKEA